MLQKEIGQFKAHTRLSSLRAQAFVKRKSLKSEMEIRFTQKDFSLICISKTSL